MPLPPKERALEWVISAEEWSWEKLNVSRLEEEFLVDKNEVRDSKVCVRM
jgi:hypothetical protein